VKRLIGLMLGVTFVAGITGSVLAQGQPAPAAPAPATAPKEEKKVEKPAEPKKPAAHNASGTVKTAAADSLVVSGKAKTGKDTDWTFAVDPKTTKIRKAGKDITAAELAAGDPVNVRYHEHDGKNVADSVMVRAPKKAAEAPKAEAPKKDEVKK
jgi:hypothetical protein